MSSFGSDGFHGFLSKCMAVFFTDVDLWFSVSMVTEYFTVGCNQDTKCSRLYSRHGRLGCSSQATVDILANIDFQ